MYKIIWKFKITEANKAVFEDSYGSQGKWAQLFRNSAGYLGTSLTPDPSKKLHNPITETARVLHFKPNSEK